MLRHPSTASDGPRSRTRKVPRHVASRSAHHSRRYRGRRPPPRRLRRRPDPASSTAGADAGYVTPGKLTFATGETAYEPYVLNDDPASGEGFEAAVAYAVAEKLGFAKEDVVWVRTSFESAIAPGPKNFDVNIQQYTITDERTQAVDFSTPYYEASQSVVAVKGGKADGVTDIAGLKGLVLGAMTGSTSAATLEEAIAPTTPRSTTAPTRTPSPRSRPARSTRSCSTPPPPTSRPSCPTSRTRSSSGSCPPPGPDQWGLLLAKDSPLTARVSEAVDTLRAERHARRAREEVAGC
jgi:polar amino acid transport system substrate-binding protein